MMPNAALVSRRMGHSICTRPTSVSVPPTGSPRLKRDDIAWVLRSLRGTFRQEDSDAPLFMIGGEAVYAHPATGRADSSADPQQREEETSLPCSFQAIRIYINSELEEVERAMEGALTVLGSGRATGDYQLPPPSRIVWLNSSSVKQEKGPEAPRGLPLTEAQLAVGRTMKSIGKAMKPSDARLTELSSRSAVLRVAERLQERDGYPYQSALEILRDLDDINFR